jgi:hypothetical protein
MIFSRWTALAVGGVSAAAMIGTAGIAAEAGSPAGAAPPAVAAPSGSAPSGTAAPADPKDRAAGRQGHVRFARLARGLHGEFVAKGKDGTYVTVVTVRGTVTAVSPTSVTIKAEDGYTATFAIGADTRVRGKEVDAIGDVRLGDSGGAVGVKSAGGITARAVLVRER